MRWNRVKPRTCRSNSVATNRDKLKFTSHSNEIFMGTFELRIVWLSWRHVQDTRVFRPTYIRNILMEMSDSRSTKQQPTAEHPWTLIRLFVCAGQVGIAMSAHWCEPASDSADDIAACERYQQFNVSKPLNKRTSKRIEKCKFVHVKHSAISRSNKDVTWT